MGVDGGLKIVPPLVFKHLRVSKRKIKEVVSTSDFLYFSLVPRYSILDLRAFVLNTNTFSLKKFFISCFEVKNKYTSNFVLTILFFFINSSEWSHDKIIIKMIF